MVGLVPTIHVFFRGKAVIKAWMLATRASMTAGPSSLCLQKAEKGVKEQRALELRRFLTFWT
jgi:hypothetical protein